MSIKLFSLLFGNAGPATVALNLESMGFGIAICSDFCVSTAI